MLLWHHGDHTSPPCTVLRHALFCDTTVTTGPRRVDDAPPPVNKAFHRCSRKKCWAKDLQKVADSSGTHIKIRLWKNWHPATKHTASNASRYIYLPDKCDCTANIIPAQKHAALCTLHITCTPSVKTLHPPHAHCKDHILSRNIVYTHTNNTHHNDKRRQSSTPFIEAAAAGQTKRCATVCVTQTRRASQMHLAGREAARTCGLIHPSSTSPRQ